MTSEELERLLQQVRGLKTVRDVKQETPKPRVPKTPKTEKLRKHGEDTAMSRYYVCSIFDMTTKIVYVCGGTGFTERLVDSLLEEEHDLYTFETQRYGETKYQIISYNGRTSYGLKTEDFSGWKEIRVLRGTGDFHFMLHNRKGRQGVVNGQAVG